MIHFLRISTFYSSELLKWSKICEWFSGFTDVSSDRTSDGFFKHVQGTSEFQFGFKSLKCLVHIFFSKSSKRICTPNEFMQKKLPTVSPTRWNFTSRLSIKVKEYRYQLCEYLKNTTDDAEIWGTEFVIKACGFLVFRKDFEIMFILEVFSDVFSFTDVLFNLLQTKEFTSCTEKRK
jgi:hypothetical protein